MYVYDTVCLCLLKFDCWRSIRHKNSMYIVCAVYAWAAYFDIFPLIKLANNLILMPKEQTAMAVVKTINDTTTDDIETPHMWKSCYTQHTYTCIDYDDNENHRELHTIKCQLWWWWWRLDIRRTLQIGRPKWIEKKTFHMTGKNFGKRKFIYADSLYFLVYKI